jgi:transcription initiation factor TFIIIB Brf1 subunit/transcription initiation factor TFIIB
MITSSIFINWKKMVIDSITCQNYGDRSRSQKYFAEASGISDVTIRNRYQELRSKIPGLSAQVTTGENEEILNINTYKCNK